MIDRAFKADITQMMLPNIDEESIESMLLLTEQFKGKCFPMMGLHPCSVKEDYQIVLDKMKLLLENGHYVGVGETGVDLYWDTTHKELQIDAFEQQVEWGKQMNLPVIIHSRDSLDLNIEIIRRNKSEELKGIFHCFSGDFSQAMQIYDLGFKIGIGGVITFKKSGLDVLLPKLPLDMVVLETDSPYLTPAPYRGKRNEPAFLRIIAQKVAESLGIGLEEVADRTTANAREVFGKKE
jgi:TatD DNase family protein